MSPEKLDQVFEKTAQQQYTRELLFSEIVEIMMPVVTNIRLLVHTSDKTQKEKIGISQTSVYNKINGIESETLLKGDRRGSDICRQVLLRSCTNTIILKHFRKKEKGKGKKEE